MRASELAKVIMKKGLIKYSMDVKSFNKKYGWDGSDIRLEVTKSKYSKNNKRNTTGYDLLLHDMFGVRTLTNLQDVYVSDIGGNCLDDCIIAWHNFQTQKEIEKYGDTLRLPKRS